MRALFVIPLVASSLLASCGTSTPVEGAQASVVGNVLRVELGTFDVAGGDSMTCFSTGFITDREYAIGLPSGMQSAGGHHISVFWTEDHTEFAPRPCTDEDMISWNMIAAAGEEPGVTADRSLPDGLAFRLPAGVHIVVQAHYINASGAPIVATDSVDLQIVPPEDVMAYAGLFALSDGAFEIPARSRYRRVSECTVSQSLDLVLLLGHLHERGAHFSLELFRNGASEGEMLYDHAWEALYTSHAPVMRWPVEAPFHIAPGDRFRMTCEWQNSESRSILFPEEMCVTSTWYYPEAGESLIVCDNELISSETL